MFLICLQTDTALTMACLGGKAEVVEHLISLDADVNYTTKNGDTVLMKACEKGNKTIMDNLLSYAKTPVDVLVSLTAQNSDGNTCLMKACAKGNLGIMVYLIDKIEQHLSDLGSDVKVK